MACTHGAILRGFSKRRSCFFIFNFSGLVSKFQFQLGPFLEKRFEIFVFFYPISPDLLQYCWYISKLRPFLKKKYFVLDLLFLTWSYNAKTQTHNQSNQCNVMHMTHPLVLLCHFFTKPTWCAFECVDYQNLYCASILCV